MRAALRFPPAAHALRLSTPVGAVVDRQPVSEALTTSLAPGDDLLGPIVVEGRDRYLVKCDDRAATLAALRALRVRASQLAVELRVDVDPVDAL